MGEVAAVLKSRTCVCICRRHHSAISWVASSILSAGRACRSALRQRRSLDVSRRRIQSRSGSGRKPNFSMLAPHATVPICLDMADHPESACFQPGRTTPAWAPTRFPGMAPLHGFTESQGPRLRKGKPFTCSDSGDCSTGTRQAIRLSGVHGTVRFQCVLGAWPVHMGFRAFSRPRALRRHFPRPYKCKKN